MQKCRERIEILSSIVTCIHSYASLSISFALVVHLMNIPWTYVQTQRHSERERKRGRETDGQTDRDRVTGTHTELLTLRTYKSMAPWPFCLFKGDEGDREGRPRVTLNLLSTFLLTAYDAAKWNDFK